MLNKLASWLSVCLQQYPNAVGMPLLLAWDYAYKARGGSPDFFMFQPGAKLAFWQSNFYSSILNNPGSLKPTVPRESFFSRERWPEKYTPKDFVKDNPVATMVIAIALLLTVVWLLPLGGRRVA